MRIFRIGVLAVLAALLAASIARAEDELPTYRRVAKWSVAYTDLAFGEVYGEAYCRFADMPRGGPGGIAPQPHCKVRLIDPRTGKTSELLARGPDITLPATAGAPLVLQLSGISPTAPTKNGPPRNDYRAVTARPGATAEFTLQDKSASRTYTAPVLARAPVDDGRVTLSLIPTSGGSLLGTWSYAADAIGERDRSGAGRAGILDTVADTPSAGFMLILLISFRIRHFILTSFLTMEACCFHEFASFFGESFSLSQRRR